MIFPIGISIDGFQYIQVIAWIALMSCFAKVI